MNDSNLFQSLMQIQTSAHNSMSESTKVQSKDVIETASIMTSLVLYMLVDDMHVHIIAPSVRDELEDLAELKRVLSVINLCRCRVR